MWNVWYVLITIVCGSWVRVVYECVTSFFSLFKSLLLLSPFRTFITWPLFKEWWWIWQYYEPKNLYTFSIVRIYLAPNVFCDESSKANSAVVRGLFRFFVFIIVHELTWGSLIVDVVYSRDLFNYILFGKCFSSVWSFTSPFLRFGDEKVQMADNESHEIGIIQMFDLPKPKYWLYSCVVAMKWKFVLHSSFQKREYDCNILYYFLLD